MDRLERSVLDMIDWRLVCVFPSQLEFVRQFSYLFIEFTVSEMSLELLSRVRRDDPFDKYDMLIKCVEQNLY
jgi:hypothetical protein